MIDRHIIDQIEEYAITMDWHVAFGGKARGNRHLFRVVTIAKFLAEKEQANWERLSSAIGLVLNMAE